MAVRYEWTIEFRDDPDPESDILDCRFYDAYADAVADGAAETDYGHWTIGLVRDVGDDVRGLVDRSWAYVKAGKLPAEFGSAMGDETGVPIPKRFHREVAQ